MIIVLQDKISTKERLSPSGATVDSFDAEDYSEYTNNDYGGMYVNDDDVLVICSVENSKTLHDYQMKLARSSSVLVNADNEIVADKYVLKPVKYSEYELLNVYNRLSELAEENQMIKTVCVDVFSNRIVIGIKNKEDIYSLNALIEPFKDMCAFELLGENSEIRDAATITGTSVIQNNTSSSTPAGRMYSNKYGCYGVITCGHGWKVGDSVNTVISQIIKIGTIKDVQFNGTNDSSFIILDQGHNYKDVKSDEIVTTVPVVGSTITLRGYASGRISGAMVTATNITVSDGTVVTKGLLKCNKPIKSGDSGGGAIGGYLDGNRTAAIVGINKGVAGNDTYLIKGKVIKEAYQ